MESGVAERVFPAHFMTAPSGHLTQAVLLPPAESRPSLFDTRLATAENTTGWLISPIGENSSLFGENTPLSPAQPKVQIARTRRHPVILPGGPVRNK